jgi:SAM-dependent methyltransferase
MTEDQAVSVIHEANRRGWNQSAAWYRARVGQHRAKLRAGQVTLHPIEERLLASRGPLGEWCQRAVHLQCSAGMDTISLHNLGAHRVIGIDIADDLIGLAGELAQDLGMPAEFVRADVLQIPDRFDGAADLVYTGKGAIHWMYDIKAWGHAVSRLLRPGGTFVLFDFHPMMWLFRSESRELEPSGISYFAPILSYREWPMGHVGHLDLPREQIEAKKIRPWPPSAVVQSLIDAGLTIVSVGEYPDTVNSSWTAYPHMPARLRRGVATTYSIVARKPDEFWA